MTNEQLNKLMADFSESAIQRTEGSQTKKGYNTTGYGYQFCVDRMNEVFLSTWGFKWEILKEKEGNYKSGAPFIEVTVKISVWIEDKRNSRSLVGGHTSNNFADALKGAITNGLKKTLALWGVGSKAFRGEIDDDNTPLPDKHDNIDNIEKKRIQIKYEEFCEVYEKIKTVITDEDKKACGNIIGYVENGTINIALLDRAISKLKFSYPNIFK